MICPPASRVRPSKTLHSCLTISNPIPWLAPVTWSIILLRIHIAYWHFRMQLSYRTVVYEQFNISYNCDSSCRGHRSVCRINWNRYDDRRLMSERQMHTCMVHISTVHAVQYEVRHCTWLTTPTQLATPTHGPDRCLVTVMWPILAFCFFAVGEWLGLISVLFPCSL